MTVGNGNGIVAVVGLQLSDKKNLRRELLCVVMRAMGEEGDFFKAIQLVFTVELGQPGESQEMDGSALCVAAGESCFPIYQDFLS